MEKLVPKLIARWVFLFFYFLGLTFLIPSIITLTVPQSLLNISAAPALLVALSIILMVAGIIGMYLLKGEFKRACKSLAWATLFPSAIAIIFLIFGRGFITGISDNYELTKPVVEYLLNGVPKTTYLIASYLIIAIGWFLLSKKR